MSDTSKALIVYASGGEVRPFVAQTMDQVEDLARKHAWPAMPPAWKWKRSREEWEEEYRRIVRDYVVRILHGAEVGFHPGEAIRWIYLVNGTPAVHSRGVTSILLRHGFRIVRVVEGKGESMIAKATITSPQGVSTEGEFSVEDARQAGLWDDRPTVVGRDGMKKANDAAWWRFRKDMLRARALSRAVYDGAAHLFGGVSPEDYAEDGVEEMRDITPARSAAPEAHGERRAERQEPIVDAELISDPTPKPIVDPAPEVDEVDALVILALADARSREDVAFVRASMAGAPGLEAACEQRLGEIGE